MRSTPSLWFDVGIKRYTTKWLTGHFATLLWFDVGIKRYTTDGRCRLILPLLWFDVGIKRYTTHEESVVQSVGCGLM